MEETFNISAIVLNKKDFRENDSLIAVYSREIGKLHLIVRGGKKIRSKLSPHCEPLTLARLMVVRGREFNYVGSARGNDFYRGLKNDLDKISVAVRALSLVERMTREGEIDGQEEVFDLLDCFLSGLGGRPFLGAEARGKEENSIDVFSRKLASILGFSLKDFEELSACQNQ